MLRILHAPAVPPAVPGRGDLVRRDEPNRLARALAFAADWLDGGRLNDMLDAFSDLTGAFGMAGAVATLTAGFGAARQRRVLLNTVPVVPLGGGPEAGLLPPGLESAARKRHRPFCLSDEAAGLPEETCGDAGRLFAVDAFIVPIHSAQGAFGCVAMPSYRALVLNAAERGALEMGARAIFEHFRERGRAGAALDFPAITPREGDCMDYVALGRSDDEIARALGISAATVRHHVDNVRSKLHAATRAQAIAILSAAGLI